MSDRPKECSLCLEAFVDPRVLPNCTHSFCKKCINRYIDSNRYVDVFPCPHPECHAETPFGPNRAEDFEKNSELVVAAKVSVCGFCGNPADKFCHQCTVSICGQCEERFHLRLPSPHCLTPLHLAIFKPISLRDPASAAVRARLTDQLCKERSLIDDQGDGWQRLGRQLGLEAGEIAEIIEDRTVPKQGARIRKMLDLWIDKENGTVQSLQEALVKCGYKGIAAQLKIAVTADVSKCGVQGCDGRADGFCNPCGIPICDQCQESFHHRLPLPHHALTPLQVVCNPNLRKLYCEKLGHERQERAWVDEDKNDILLCAMCEQELPVRNKTEVPEKARRLREHLRCEVESCCQSIKEGTKLDTRIRENKQGVNDELDRLKEEVEIKYREFIAAVEKEKNELISLLNTAKKENDKRFVNADKELSSKIATAEEVIKTVNEDVNQLEDIDVVLVSKTKSAALKEQQSAVSNEMDKQRKVKLSSVSLAKVAHLSDTLFASAKINMINIASPFTAAWRYVDQVATPDCVFVRLFFDTSTNCLLGQCSDEHGHDLFHIYDVNQLAKITDVKTEGVFTRHGMLATAKGLFVANANDIVQMKMEPQDKLVVQRRLPYRAKAICSHSETSFLFYEEPKGEKTAYVSLYDLEKGDVVERVKVPKSHYNPKIAYSGASNSFLYTYTEPFKDSRLLVQSMSNDQPATEMLPGKELYVHTDHLDNVFILELWPDCDRLYWLDPATNQPEEVVQLSSRSIRIASLTTDRQGNMYVDEENTITKYRYLPD